MSQASLATEVRLFQNRLVSHGFHTFVSIVVGRTIVSERGLSGGSVEHSSVGVELLEGVMIESFKLLIQSAIFLLEFVVDGFEGTNHELRLKQLDLFDFDFVRKLLDTLLLSSIRMPAVQFLDSGVYYTKQLLDLLLFEL